MGIKHINPDGMMKTPVFSQAVVTSGTGRTIYIGGQNAVNEKGEVIGKGDIAAQTEQVMKNIVTALEACGATMKDVVKLNIFITQGQDAQKGFEASQKFMPKDVKTACYNSPIRSRNGKPRLPVRDRCCGLCSWLTVVKHCLSQ